MKKLFSFLTFTFLLLNFQFASAQNVGIGTNLRQAALDVSSTTNGFLPPRMTFEQRNAIVNPTQVLIIYMPPKVEFLFLIFALVLNYTR